MPHQEFYFHGTDAMSAHAILQNGFTSNPEQIKHGSARGKGVYVAHNFTNAAIWGHVILETTLVQGTRILWVDGKYDPKTIKSLSKEFGREILEVGTDILKAMPSNKRLQGDELFHLCNYVYSVCNSKQKTKSRYDYKERWINMQPLNRLIRRYKFDGVGEDDKGVWDGDEVLVFNPASVVATGRIFVVDKKMDPFDLPKKIEVDRYVVSSAEINVMAQKEKAEWDEWERESNERQTSTGEAGAAASSEAKES